MRRCSLRRLLSLQPQRPPAVSAAEPAAYRAGREIGREWLERRVYHARYLIANGREIARRATNRPARAFWLGVTREARSWPV